MLAQIALLVFASARRRRLADASEIYYTETLKASPLSDGWVWVFAPCAPCAEVRYPREQRRETTVRWLLSTFGIPINWIEWIYGCGRR